MSIWSMRAPGVLHIAHQEHGGRLLVTREGGLPRPDRIADPRTGAVVSRGERAPGEMLAGDRGRTARRQLSEGA